jgi:hypothetical protein
VNLEERAREDASKLRSDLEVVPVVPFDRVRRTAQKRRSAISAATVVATIALTVLVSLSLPGGSTDVADQSVPAPSATTSPPSLTTTSIAEPPTTTSGGPTSTASDATERSGPLPGCESVRLTDVRVWGVESVDATDSVVAFIDNSGAEVCREPDVVKISLPGLASVEASLPAVEPDQTIAVRWDVCSNDGETERFEGSIALRDASLPMRIDYEPAPCPVFAEPVVWTVPERSTGEDLEVLRLEYRTIGEAPTYEFTAQHPDLGFTFSGAVDLFHDAFQMETIDGSGATSAVLVYGGVEYERVGNGSWADTGREDADQTTASWLDRALLGDWYTFGVALDYGVVTEVDDSGHEYKLDLDSDTFERATSGPNDSTDRNVSIVVTLDDDFGIGTVEITTTTPRDSTTALLTIWNRFGPEAIDEP